MWKPVGPLPASVYWRRRLVALATTITALVILAWSVAAVVAPAGNETSTRATGRAAMTAPQPTDPSPVPVVPGTGTVPVGRSHVQREVSSPPPPPPPAPEATPGETATTSEVPATTAEVVLPDDTPRAPVPVPPSVPVPPTGPVQCTNEMLSVSAEIGEPEHRIGERPTLRLVVVNISDQPCIRDLDGARQEIVVWSGDGADRLWSSNDCVNPTTVDLRTLVPGQPVAFSVRWAGRTTVPGCSEERTVVPAGAYRVMTRIDDLISAPTPFLRSP